MDPTDTNPAKVPLYNHRVGTTWRGIETIGPAVFITDETPEGASPDAAAESAEFSLVNLKDRTKRMDFSSADGSIVIDDAATWEMHVPEMDAADFDLPAGTYEGQFIVTDANGTVWPWADLSLVITPNPNR